ncbi:MAG: hypothetical protein M1837_002841 [Sclerophora amabilis]|nr:MAG: hypothetical protein M1837_002841 [Sclerophora amabilis]
MSLSDLPPELCQQILTYLPVPSLLSFGLTSCSSHALAHSSLRTLSLGVFHTRISGLMSFLDSTLCREDQRHAVSILLSKRDSRTRSQVIDNQNRRAAEILSRHATSLRDLELVLWELKLPVTDVLKTMPTLRRLSLRFDHPHTRHASVNKTYWETSPPGSIWNLLATQDGFRDGPTTFGRLEAINLERCGLTDYQLRQIIKRNPGVKEIRLQRCLTVTGATFEYLSRSPVAHTLETLHFTQSNSREIDERILDYIPKLTALKSLSLRGCQRLDPERIKSLNAKEWRIPHLVLPARADGPRDASSTTTTDSAPGSGGVILEVDPAYK